MLDLQEKLKKKKKEIWFFLDWSFQRRDLIVLSQNLADSKGQELLFTGVALIFPGSNLFWKLVWADGS